MQYVFHDTHAHVVSLDHAYPLRNIGVKSRGFLHLSLHHLVNVAPLPESTTMHIRHRCSSVHNNRVTLARSGQVVRIFAHAGPVHFPSAQLIEDFSAMCTPCCRRLHFWGGAQPAQCSGPTSFTHMQPAASQTSLRTDFEATHRACGPYTPLQSVIAKPRAKQRAPPGGSTSQSIGVHIWTLSTTRET